MKQFGHRGWKYIVNFAIIHRSKGDSANIKSICLEWISSGVLTDIILSSLNNFLFLFMWTNYLLVNISTPTTARYLACVVSAQTSLPVSTLTTAFAHLHGFHRDHMKLSKSHHITLLLQTLQCLAVCFWGRDLCNGCQGLPWQLRG